jgi:hypothetical protein
MRTQAITTQTMPAPSITGFDLRMCVLSSVITKKYDTRNTTRQRIAAGTSVGAGTRNFSRGSEARASIGAKSARPRRPAKRSQVLVGNLLGLSHLGSR